MGVKVEKGLLDELEHSQLLFSKVNDSSCISVSFEWKSAVIYTKNCRIRGFVNIYSPGRVEKKTWIKAIFLSKSCFV